MSHLGKSPAFTYGLFLQRVNDHFGPTLGDDEITAAAVVISGPSPYLMIWLTTTGAFALAWLFRTTLGVDPLTHSGGFWAYETATMAGYVCAALPSLFIQRSMLIAVTNEQVLVSRWSRLRRRSSRVSFMPAVTTGITGRRGGRITSIVLVGQGTGPIRLHAIRPKRADLHYVLRVAHMAGASVVVRQ